MSFIITVLGEVNMFVRNVVAGLVMSVVSGVVMADNTPQVNKYKYLELYNVHKGIVFHNLDEFTCLAENIYYESRGEPYIGKIAVAQITFNRAEKVGSFCEVVHKPKQFSWTLNKNLKKPHGKEWEASVHAASMFTHGVRVKNLDKVEHYHTGYVNPIWDNGMSKIATIGGHDFYGE